MCIFLALLHLLLATPRADFEDSGGQRIYLSKNFDNGVGRKGGVSAGGALTAVTEVFTIIYYREKISVKTPIFGAARSFSEHL